MEKQTLKQKLSEILKDVPKDEAIEVLDNAYKTLTGTNSKTYNDKNAL